MFYYFIAFLELIEHEEVLNQNKLKKDKVIQEAVKVLNDKDQYAKILSGA